MEIQLCLVVFLALTAHSYAAYCVCKDGVSDQVLQKALDYACGAGADCSPILQNGPCYQPNTVKAHCDYAVNSYFQKKGGAQGTCDFGGAATISSSAPSASGTCTFPSGSSGTGTMTPTSPTGSTPPTALSPPGSMTPTTPTTGTTPTPPTGTGINTPTTGTTTPTTGTTTPTTGTTTPTTGTTPTLGTPSSVFPGTGLGPTGIDSTGTGTGGAAALDEKTTSLVVSLTLAFCGLLLFSMGA